MTTETLPYQACYSPFAWEDQPMRRVNVYEFYKLGVTLRSLKEERTQNVKRSVIFFEIYSARTELGSFMVTWGAHLAASRAPAQEVERRLSEMLGATDNAKSREAF